MVGGFVGYASLVNKVIKSTVKQGIEYTPLVGIQTFNGTSDGFQISDQFTFDTQFTIEFWVNPTANAQGAFKQQGQIVGTANRTVGKTQWAIFVGGGVLNSRQANLGFYYGRYGGQQTIKFDSTLTAGQWSHVAFVRNSSNVWKLFINGQLTPTYIFNQNTSWSDSVKPTTDPVFVGKGQMGFFSGQMANLLITNGYAVYTDNFIPIPP